MGRTSNQEHVRRTLEAIAYLRTEPGWHRITELAERVAAKPDRLGMDLRRVHYSAGFQSVPLMFGDDFDPPHPDGPAVVRFIDDMPISLPLPASRVELTRIALVAEAAVSVDPFTSNAAVLRSLQERLLGLLDVEQSLRSASIDAIPPTVSAARRAIDTDGAITFDYRSLDDDAATTRHVMPSKVWRAGTGWLLLGRDLDHDGERTYRFDRIVGDVAPHVLPNGLGPIELPKEPAQVSRTKVRLRVESEDLWVTENYTPSDLVRHADGRVDVTIELYPPVNVRLARLLFLLRPGASVVTPLGRLDAYDAQLDALAQLYGVPVTR